MADVVTAVDGCQRLFTRISAPNGFAALERRQFARTAEHDAICPHKLAPSLVRATIRCGSNSATPPRTVTIIRPERDPRITGDKAKRPTQVAVHGCRACVRSARHGLAQNQGPADGCVVRSAP